MLAVGTSYDTTTGRIQPTLASGKYTPVNFMIVNTKAVVCPVKLYETKLIDSIKSLSGEF